MVNVTKSMIVNSEDWEYLRGQNINISMEIRKFLSSLRGNISSGEDFDTTIELEKLKQLKLQKQAKKLHFEVSKNEKLLLDLETKAEEFEENRLLEEKKQREAKLKCGNCASPFADDTQKVVINENLIVCKRCFHDGSYKKD